MTVEKLIAECRDALGAAFEHMDGSSFSFMYAKRQVKEQIERCETALAALEAKPVATQGEVADKVKKILWNYGIDEVISNHAAENIYREIADIAAIPKAQPVQAEQPDELPPEWRNGMAFAFCDDPGEHDPCHVVCPNGWMLPFNFSAKPGSDIACAKWVIAACNSYMERSAQGPRELAEAEKAQAVEVLKKGWGKEYSNAKPGKVKPDKAWSAALSALLERFELRRKL